MKKRILKTTVEVYASEKELSLVDQKLLKKAKQALKKSYSPYSNFKVGAAILLNNGKMMSGSNQENAAYPSGMCAERVAIWKASSSFPNKKVKKIAIAAISSNKKLDRPVGPCGACRQTLFEYEVKQGKDVEVIFMGEIGNVIKTNSIASLLPFSFDNTYL